MSGRKSAIRIPPHASLRRSARAPAEGKVEQRGCQNVLHRREIDDEAAERQRLCSAGLAVEREGELLLTRQGLRELSRRLVAVAGPGPAEWKPRWDSQCRTLLWGSQVIKRLRRAAEAQEAVLQAFEAHCWPERIEDPLDPEPDLDAKERLRETVKSLNRGLAPRLIRFHADGTGRAIRWEPC